MAMSRMTLKSVANVPKAQTDSTQTSEAIALHSPFGSGVVWVRGRLARVSVQMQSFSSWSL